jgi:hypothetical protein
LKNLFWIVLFDQARNLCPICFIFPLFPCRAVAGVSSGLPILFSCFVPLSHANTVVVSRFYSLATSVLHGSNALCWVSRSDLLVGFHFLDFLSSILSGRCVVQLLLFPPSCLCWSHIDRAPEPVSSFRSGLIPCRARHGRRSHSQPESGLRDSRAQSVPFTDSSLLLSS